MTKRIRVITCSSVIRPQQGSTKKTSDGPEIFDFILKWQKSKRKGVITNGREKHL